MSLTILTHGVVSCAVLSAVLSAQIDRLGNPRYAVREAAFAALKDAGDVGAGVARQALRHPDPEVRRRCEALVREFETARVGQIKPSGHDFYPWINHLPIARGKSTVEGRIMDAYWHMTYDTTQPGRPQARELTKSMVVDLARAGVPKAKIVAILDDMIRSERTVQQRRGLPFPDMGRSPLRRPGFSIEFTPVPKKDKQ
jgi:hypothetical protein